MTMSCLPEQITQRDRSAIKHHLPAVLWFTGLSASGKSTVARQVEYRLATAYSAHTYLLDGDAIRGGLNRDLDFSETARHENIRRVGEVARLFYDAGLIVLTAFISPFEADRTAARSLLPAGAFVEIFVNCPLQVCEQRDPKGLYRRARAGLISDFTGIDSPYEAPSAPELVLHTDTASVADCVGVVLRHLDKRQIVRPLQAPNISAQHPQDKNR
jgi:adenylylsulfate kinase